MHTYNVIESANNRLLKIIMATFENFILKLFLTS